MTSSAPEAILGGGRAREPPGEKKSVDQKQLRLGKRVLLGAFATYVALFFLKTGVGVSTGSLTLRSDGFHNLIDAFGFVGVLLGFVVAHREPSAKYPYGLYKLENLIALGLAAVIFYQAYEFVADAIAALRAGTVALSFSPWAIGAPVVSIGSIAGCTLLLKASLLINAMARSTVAVPGGSAPSSS